MMDGSPSPESKTSESQTTAASSFSAQPLRKTRLYELGEANAQDVKGRADGNGSLEEQPYVTSLKPSIPFETYKGVQVTSGQSGSLQLIDSLELNDTKYSLNDLRRDSTAEEDVTVTPSSRRYDSFETSDASTPSKMRDSSRTSFSSYQYMTPSKTRSYRITPQKKTFEQQAQDQGLRKWDPEKPDDRWLLASEEIRAMSARYKHALTATPEHLGEDDTLVGDSVQQMNYGSPLRKSERQHLNDSSAKGTALDNIGSAIPKPSSPSNFIQSLVPTPLEATRLDKLVNDLQAGRVQINRPYCARELKPYFYDIVFGNQNGPDPLDTTESSKLTYHNHQTKCLADLRREVLDNIDDLVAFVVSPAGQGLQEHKYTLHQKVNGRESSYQVASNKELAEAPNFVLPSTGQHSRNAHLAWEDLHSSQASEPETATSSDGIAQINQSRDDGFHVAPDGPFLARSEKVDFNAQQAHQGMRNFMQIHHEGNPPAFQYESEAHYRKLQAQTNPWETTYGQSHFQQPNNMHSTNFAYPQSGRQTPAPSFHKPLQPQQRMTHQHVLNAPIPAYNSHIPYYHLGNNMYTANGIHIPNDRLVRPPATSRRAPMFAQTGAWQANNINPYSPSPQPDRNHFGTPTPRLRDTRRLTYIEGSDDMFPQASTGSGGSVRLQVLSRSQPPQFDLVSSDNNIPFAESARASRPAEWGVLKLGNIPYDLSKAAVTAFLGNHAKLITPDLGPSVHIVMDRPTGKTQDCFVEFYSRADAQAWEKYLKNRGNGLNRIGDRLIDISLSSQDELLKELFPRAKNVSWEGGHPVVIPPEDQYNTGFKVFLQAEELQILVRHAEQPQRSNYTMKCQNRPYEAMVSLLTKFPWQATSLYTLQTRNRIFDAAVKMLAILAREARRNGLNGINRTQNGPILPFGGPSVASANGFGPIIPRSTPGVLNNQLKPLNMALLKELLSAGLNAIGFSERQRWEFHKQVKDFDELKLFLVSPIAEYWPFEVVGRKANREEDVVEWYAGLLANHPNVRALSTGTTTPFGDLGQLLSNIQETETMDSCGSREWSILANLLADMCLRQGQHSSHFQTY